MSEDQPPQWFLTEAARHPAWPPDSLAPAPTPNPETSPADRDSDRLATELFRRYGEVQRGQFRTRDHWVADADAVREILARDLGFARIVEGIAASPVRMSPDSEAHFRSFNEGWDEAWSHRDEDDDELLLVVAATSGALGILIGLVAGWLVERRGAK